MKTRILLLASLLLTVMTAGSALGATYFVRTDGIDTNTGLENSPDGAWQTIQNAVNSIVAGDVIIVEVGEYPEQVVINVAGNATSGITLQGNGEVTVQSISFSPSPYAGSPYPPAINYYWTLDNLRFRGATPGTRSGVGLSLEGSSWITVSNCDFRGYTTGVLFDRNYYTANFFNQFTNCNFQDNTNGTSIAGCSGGLENSIFRGCTFTGNDVGFNVPCYGIKLNLFDGCTFTDNRLGMVLDGIYYGSFKTRDNTVVRCTFAHNQIGLIIGSQWAQTGGYYGLSYGNSVRSSIFYANSDTGLRINTDFTSYPFLEEQGQTITNCIFLDNGNYGIDNFVNKILFVSNNLAFNNLNGAGNNAAFDLSTNSLVADPLLVNAPAGDYRLLPGSPAIDAGNPDFDTDPLLQGDHIDIGLIEFVDTYAPVTTSQMSGTQSLDGWYSSIVDVELLPTDPGFGVSEVHYSLNGAPDVVIDFTTYGESTIPFSVTTEGTTLLTYYSIDMAGNTESAHTVPVRIDMTPPATLATASGVPGTNGWYRSDVMVNLEATDNLSGVSGISVGVDGSTPTLASGQAIAVPVSGDGIHGVMFGALDFADNVEQYQSLSVAIDTTPPAAQLTLTPTELKSNGKLQDVVIGGSASDLMSGVASVEIAVTNLSGAVVATTNNFDNTVQIVGIKGESYMITATVTDLAGNSTSVSAPLPVK